MTHRDKHLLYLEIAKLVEAGFGMRETAKTIQATGVSAEQQELLASVVESLENSASIADAFDHSPMDLSEMEKSIIDAGERTARLAPAFQELGEYFELLATSRKEMIKSLIYPAVLFHVGILISVVPLTIGAEPLGGWSILLRFVIALVMGYLVIYGMYYGLKRLFEKAPEDAKIDRLLGKIPFLGKARKMLALARFTKVYHGSLVSGLSMSQTVAMSCRASNSGVIQEAGNDLLKVVADGHEIGPELQKHEVFPAAFSRSYLTAEKAGSLDEDLARWGKVFGEDAQKSAKRLSVVVPQICYGLVAIYIGWKIVSFYGGYYQQIEDAIEGDF